MSMADADYGAQAPPPPPPDEGAIDKRYVKGIPGLLKLLQGVLSLIAFICATVSLCVGGVAVKGYFQFTSMGAFIVTLLLWLLLLLKLHKRICKCACVNWPFFEFMVYAVICVFYFFADLFMSIFSCDAARKAACVFGWFAFGAFITDFSFSLRIWLAARKAAREGTDNAEAPKITEPRY